MQTSDGERCRGHVTQALAPRLWICFGLLLLCMRPGEMFGGTAERKPQGTAVRKAPFVLTIHDNLVSLTARDASIKEVIEEIGRRMNIQVVARLSAEERMTLTLEKLPLAEAIKRFDKYINYMVLEEATQEPGRITKIIVFSKREGPAPSSPPGQSRDARATAEPNEAVQAEPPQVEPFKFELNPSDALQRD